MAKAFVPEQFVPTAHSSAADKAKFANHMIRFIESGFKDTLFPKWFYQRLSMTFSHIAHYNQAGFYSTWFSGVDEQALFLAHLLNQTPCGDPAYTYSDVERALQRVIASAGYLNKYRALVNAKEEARERAELDRLQKKYNDHISASIGA